MSKVILLYTDWDWDFWDKDGEAPYPTRSYKELPGWSELKDCLPLPALGIYGKLKRQDLRSLPFSYLVVKGMEADAQEAPCFYYSYLAKSKVKSELLLGRLRHHRLFEVREASDVLQLLRALGEEPPPEWLRLLDAGKIPLQSQEAWRYWIGERFLCLLDTKISNEDFENITADVFRALGFEVNQMGHKRPGSYPDGTLVSPTADFAIVYDCKNTDNYYPTAEHQRALAEYLEKEGKRLQEQKRVRSVYSMFIARSFAQAELKGAHIFISADDLLYALFKRLRLGKDFALTAFDDLAKRNGRIDRQFMDREWAEIPVS